MKLEWVLFACLLGMCLLIGVLFTIEETPFEEDAEGNRTYLGHGFEHPEYSTMQMGGPGRERHEKIIWIGLAFGVLQIIFFVVSIAVGGSKSGKVGPLKIPLFIGGTVFALVFCVLMLTYRATMGDTDPVLALSFPKATAWMIYGVWGVPAVFIVLYSFMFDRWTFTEEDAARLKELVAERSASVEDTV